MEEDLNKNVLLCRSQGCEEKYYTMDRKAKYCKSCGYELIDKCPGCGVSFTMKDCGMYCIFCGKQIKFKDDISFFVASNKFSDEPGFKQLKSNSLNLGFGDAECSE